MKKEEKSRRSGIPPEAGKKDLGKGYKRIKELADKTKVELEKILKVISKEADLGSKFLKQKVSVFNLDTEIEKKYRELGKEAYRLINDGAISEPGLIQIGGEIDKMYNKINQARQQMENLKTQMVKAKR